MSKRLPIAEPKEATQQTKSYHRDHNSKDPIIADGATHSGIVMWCALVPALFVPLAFILLAACGEKLLAAFLLTFYALPPMFVAEAFGITSNGSSVYSSSLFAGYMLLAPTFPFGYIFCSVVWSVIGFVVGLIYVEIRYPLHK